LNSSASFGILAVRFSEPS